MWQIGSLILFLLGVLSLRGNRRAYIAFVVLGLLYFPAKVGFRLDPHPCQITFDAPLAIHSLTNYAHIVLFALFFVMRSAQFRTSDWSAFGRAAGATIAMGVLVEVAQGVTGTGNCRLRDLIPDSVGALAGSVIVLLLHKIGWRPRPSWSLVGWRR